MDIEKARDILSHIVEQRVRWGKQYDASDIGINKVTDALVAIAHYEGDETAELRKSLATANRQGAASNARETKLKKKIDSLLEENAALQQVVDKLYADKDLDVNSGMNLED